MFEHLGFFKEYYVDNKFIGSVHCEKDRETIGYVGRETEAVLTKVVCTNGKIIKEGTIAVTMLYPLCGKYQQKPQI